MKLKVFLIMAFRFLGIGSSKLESNARKSLFGAMLGIGISIIPLIIVLVVSDGMIQGITSRTIELGTSHIQLINMRPLSKYKKCEIEEMLVGVILENFDDDYVKNAWIERQGNGLVVGKNGRSGGTIRAIEPEFFLQNEKAKKLLKIRSGSFEFPEKNSCILGEKIAKDLGLNNGDRCRIITLQKNADGNAVPKISSFKVSGIVSSGYEELDALWVFIPLEAGIKILDLNSSLTSILISTEDAFNEKKLLSLKERLELILPNNFYSYTWFELNQSTFVSFKTTKNILMFIMFLIALVASANISSAVVMLVMERRREIAILKASGTHPFYISLAFLFSGFLTCLAGLLLGMPLGILAAIHINEIFAMLEKVLNFFKAFAYSFVNNGEAFTELRLLNPAYYLEEIPIVLNFTELYTISVSMLILSIVVCLIPSIRAGREKPIEIMRKI